MSSEWGAEDAGVAVGPTVDVGSIEADVGVDGDGCEANVAGAAARLGRALFGNYVESGGHRDLLRAGVDVVARLAYVVHVQRVGR